MKQFSRVNQSKVATYLLFALCFAWMLFLNIKTPFIVDDFVYAFSFTDGTPIRHLSDIFSSMVTHSRLMNGRVISHGLEQFFMLFPAFVFDVCNAAVFSFVVLRLTSLAQTARDSGDGTGVGRKPARNAALMLTVFCCIWMFTPVLGQAALWQVGSLNYLWGVAALLLFITPYVNEYLCPGKMWAWPWRIGFVILSFFIGLYTEVSSFAAIAVACMLLFCARVILKQRVRLFWLLPIVAAIAGYICMLLIPAELAAKQGELSFAVLYPRFISLTKLAIRRFWPLFAAWLVLFIVALVRKLSLKRILLSVIIMLGAGICGYMLMAASYLAERCLCPVPALVVLSCAVLLPHVERLWWRIPAAAVFVCLLAISSYRLVIGGADIIQCRETYDARVRMVEEGKAAGQTDFVLPLTRPETEYSPFYDVRDLSTTDPSTWPNSSMAKLYGVSSILGTTEATDLEDGSSAEE